MNPTLPLARWLFKLLRFTLQSYPEEIRVSPLAGHVQRIRFRKKTHRINGDGSPELRPAIVTLLLDDESARNLEHLRRDDGHGDAWILVRVRRHVMDRFASPVKLAGEKG